MKISGSFKTGLVFQKINLIRKKGGYNSFRLIPPLRPMMEGSMKYKNTRFYEDKLLNTLHKRIPFLKLEKHKGFRRKIVFNISNEFVVAQNLLISDKGLSEQEAFRKCVKKFTPQMQKFRHFIFSMKNKSLQRHVHQVNSFVATETAKFDLGRNLEKLSKGLGDQLTSKIAHSNLSKIKTATASFYGTRDEETLELYKDRWSYDQQARLMKTAAGEIHVFQDPLYEAYMTDKGGVRKTKISSDFDKLEQKYVRDRTKVDYRENMEKLAENKKAVDFAKLGAEETENEVKKYEDGSHQFTNDAPEDDFPVVPYDDMLPMQDEEVVENDVENEMPLLIQWQEAMDDQPDKSLKMNMVKTLHDFGDAHHWEEVPGEEPKWDTDLIQRMLGTESAFTNEELRELLPVAKNQWNESNNGEFWDESIKIKEMHAELTNGTADPKECTDKLLHNFIRLIDEEEEFLLPGDEEGDQKASEIARYEEELEELERKQFGLETHGNEETDHIPTDYSPTKLSEEMLFQPDRNPLWWQTQLNDKNLKKKWGGTEGSGSKVVDWKRLRQEMQLYHGLGREVDEYQKERKERRNN